MRDGFVQSFIARFKLLSHFLGTNPYFAGDKVSNINVIETAIIKTNLSTDKNSSS